MSGRATSEDAEWAQEVRKLRVDLATALRALHEIAGGTSGDPARFADSILLMVTGMTAMERAMLGDGD